MRYPHLLAALRSSKWAIQSHTLEAIRDVMTSRLVRGPDRGGETTIVATNPRRISASPGAAPQSSVPGYAVVRFHGICAKRISEMEADCGGVSLETLQRDLTAAMASSRVGGIILHLDSPGGVVTGIPELRARIQEWSKQKPIYAFTDNCCASAAYWLATGCTAIFATPTADVGSIGVYMLAIDDSEAWAEEGYKMHLIKAGDRKAEGCRGIPIAPETLAIWQQEVDELYLMFTSAVTDARPAVEVSSMQGQCFMGEAALKAGLIDDIVMDLDDLVAKLAV